ncbi:uncharacterized protein LOC119658285 [Hermetia illucens]|uniref:uncharacterized protein LOC119658285 n=1 Tax=Hermetia illucens TaxID=343691 RepID=UPI0018CC53F7|nr:uncharacterized protein LOC119658285 [Hermetia illucens]
MTRKENACTLYQLAVHKSLRIVEKALWLILFVYKCKMKLTSWTPEQNCTVFLNMFKTSNEVRKLSGELMLSMLTDYSDARKLTSILDFYIQYKSSPEDIPILIDALWGFNYMTNVENIIILFQSPVRDSNTMDFQIRNAALAHFWVAMVDRLIKCDSYDREKVVNFLKAMPFLLKKLQNTPVAVTILCKIFSMVDLAMYEPHYIGDKKYADDLSKQFGHILSQCSDYQCLQSIMKAFVEFSSAGFAEFKIGFSRIAVSILNGFEAVNYKWATEGDGVGDEGFEELKLASCRLSILLSHEFTLDESEFQAIYDILNITIFTNDHLKHIPQKFRIIEIYYLESFSNLLLTRLIQILDASQIDSEYILQTKNKIIMVSSRLQELLTQSEESLFNREKVTVLWQFQ